MRRASPPDEDESPNINYTLSLAAVKSGYLDAMAAGGGGGSGGGGGGGSGGGVSVSVDSQGCEVSVEERQEGSTEPEKQRKHRDGNEKRDKGERIATNVSWAGDASLKNGKDKSETDNQSRRSGRENTSVRVPSKLRGAQKRFSRLVKKARGKKKSTDDRLAESQSQSNRTPSYLTSYSGGVSSLGVSSRDVSSEGSSNSSVVTTIVDGKAGTAKEGEPEATIEVVVDELPVSSEMATPKVTNSESGKAEMGKTLQSESTPLEIERYAVLPTDRSIEMSIKAPVEVEPLVTKGSIGSKAKQSILRKKTSETADDNSSISSNDDDQQLHDKPKFIMSKVSNKTYIINQATSMVEPAWSSDEKTTQGGALNCLTCGLCTVQEEWDDDDFDDEEEDDDEDEDEDEDDEEGSLLGSHSEEGRVADAVITIQEHAKRLGLSEYELLQMINEE